MASPQKRNPKQRRLGLLLPQLRLLSRAAGVSGDGVPPSLARSALKDGSPSTITELYLGWDTSHRRQGDEIWSSTYADERNAVPTVGAWVLCHFGRLFLHRA